MKVFAYRTTLLAVALALATGGVCAQTSAKRDAAHAKELAEARAELARAAKRVAELSQNSAEVRKHRAQIERIRTRKPVIGVLLAPDGQTGVRIAGVTPDSAAAKAGLQAGDRIVSVNGVQVLGNTGELRLRNTRQMLDKLDDKTAAKLGYQRGGRNAVVSVTPQVSGAYTLVFDDGEPGTVMRNVVIDTDRINEIVKNVKIKTGDLDYDFDFDFEGMDFDPPPGITPEIREELRRISPACKGKDCKAPMMLSAFRWNGLNLASVDPQLGRYFGADKGVLVLSNGELDGLQAGDVIQKIDGKTVNSPREAMDILRDKPADAKVTMTYLRDRKPADAQIKVPNVWAFPAPPKPPVPPAPPRAPAPPKPPTAPTKPPTPPPAPPAPPRAPSASTTSGLPAPPAPPTFLGDGAINYVFVSEDGRTTSYSWSADDAEPNVLEEVREVEVKTR